jgi:nicotinamidase-related amidase
MAVPGAGFTLDPMRAALLVTDPQSDLRPEGVTWGVADYGRERATGIPTIERLLEAARHASMVVAIAPHYTYPDDQRWGFGTILPECRPYLLGGRTIVAAPHRAWRSDMRPFVAQLRSFGVTQVVLVGVWATPCVESYLRALLEDGFEVAVVKDATAAAIASAFWSPDEALRRL